jgi:hypothetical protein
VPERTHTPERAPAPAAKAAPAKVVAPPARGAATNSHASVTTGPRRPPPPVVPVLKGAKGQIAKKKER